MSEKVSFTTAMAEICRTDDERGIMRKCVDDGLVPSEGEGEGDARTVDKDAFSNILVAMRSHTTEMKGG